MKLTKEQLKPLGGFVLHGTINCLLAGATGGAAPLLNGIPSIIAGLAGAITGNLASNHVATLSNLSYNNLLAKLNDQDPNNVNHDLERLFRSAAVVSLEFIKTLFLKEVVTDERITTLTESDRKKFLNDLTLFFNENISDLRLVTKDDKTSINKTLVKDPTQFLDNTVEQIFRMTSVMFDSETEKQIKAFYANHLPYCFELAFKEALKNDDHGFKAFQIWILEEMRDQNALILQDTKNILIAIENISNAKNLLSQEQFDEILNKQKDDIYTQLQTVFFGIKNDLDNVTAQINHNYDKLYKLTSDHFDLSKQSHELIKEMIGLLKLILEKFDTPQPSDIFPHELNNIPRHTDEFIGRETELISLEKQLHQSAKVVLVNGIGGIGKSTLAKKFVQAHIHQYDHVAWVEVRQNDAGQPGTNWEDAFIEAFAYDKTLWLQGLHLQIDDNASLLDRFYGIIHSLKNLKGKNLLVIDNTGEEIKKFNKILPSPPSWQVLVTSRNNLTGFTPFHLDKLKKESAIELFKSWFEADEQEIKVLLEEIDYHTLMIEMLAKTLAASRQRLTIQYVTEQLKGGHLNDAKLQRKIELSHTEEETNLFRHLLVTFRLSGLNEKHNIILKNFYFLLPQYYTLDTIFYLFSTNEEEKDEIVERLDELVQKGWLNREDDNYSMHRLIQQAVYYQLNPINKDAETLIDIFTNLTFTNAFSDRRNIYQYIPYADYLISKMSSKESVNPGIAPLLNNLGVLYKDIQQYKKAEAAYGEALALYRKLAEDNPAAFEPDVAGTLNNLGNLYRIMRQYKEGEATLRETLTLYRKLSEDNPAAFEPDVAMTLNNLGVLYRNIQQYEEAETTYFEALNIRRKLAEDNPAAFEPDVATTLNNLGNLYCDLQQYKEGETVYEEALALYRKLAEDNPAAFEPDVAMTLNNLGILYCELQKYKEAEVVFIEAIGIRRKLVKDNPAAFEPHVATALNNLGNLYRDLQQYEEAETTYLEALSIRRKLAKSNPATFEPDVATTLNNLGNLYCDLQQYKKAEAAYGEALSIKREQLNKNQFIWAKVVDLYLKLADTYKYLLQKKDSILSIKWGLVFLTLYYTSQDEANPFMRRVNEMLTDFGLDPQEFYDKEVWPTVEQIQNKSA